MATHESGETASRLKFICDICGASYAREFALNIHKEEMHSNEAMVIEEEEYVIEEAEIDNSNSEVYSIVT